MVVYWNCTDETSKGKNIERVVIYSFVSTNDLTKDKHALTEKLDRSVDERSQIPSTGIHVSVLRREGTSDWSDKCKSHIYTRWDIFCEEDPLISPDTHLLKIY